MDFYSLGIYEKAMPPDWSWEQKMKTAANYGFSYIEMSIDETEKRCKRLEWSGEQRKQFAGLTSSVLPVTSICLSAHRKYPMGSHDVNIRRQSMEIMNRAVELAYDIGVRIIQLAGYDVYYDEMSDEDSRKYFTENLTKATEYAAAHGILLGLETMENDFMNTVEKAMEFVKKVNQPYLGVYPDVGNLSNAGVCVTEDICLGAGHIFSAHLKETNPGIFRNMRFGCGQVDFKSITETLFRLGVRRYTAECWYLPGDNAEETLAHTYSYLTEFLKKAAVKSNDKNMKGSK